MTDEYKDLLAAAKAANQGDWRYGPGDGDQEGPVVFVDLPTVSQKAISVLFQADWATEEDAAFVAKASPKTVQALIAEIDRLKGIRPDAAPRPPAGSGLPRYGIRWNGPDQPLSVPMDNGYWTPWHLAANVAELLEGCEPGYSDVERLCKVLSYLGVSTPESMEQSCARWLSLVRTLLRTAETSKLLRQDAETIAEYERLKAENEALRADASRYRYMRDFPHNIAARAVGVTDGRRFWLQGEEADHAIDKAMADDADLIAAMAHELESSE